MSQLVSILSAERAAAPPCEVCGQSPWNGLGDGCSVCNPDVVLDERELTFEPSVLDGTGDESASYSESPLKIDLHRRRLQLLSLHEPNRY